MKTIRFAGEDAVSDLKTLLERLVHAGSSEARIVSRPSGVSVFASTLHPVGLTDTTPMVLVHRGIPTVGDTASDRIDVVVEVRALLDRVPRLTIAPFDLSLPPQEVTAVWAGILPPHAGWERAGEIDAASLSDVARAGAERVSSSLPVEPGQALVDRVRRDVWGVEVLPGVPAGAAFALETLGFLDDQARVTLHRSKLWGRLSTKLGDVFVRA